MKVHVLPGDCLTPEFKKTGIDGEMIICREALVSGDVDAESLPEFWDQRARFISSAFAEDQIEYHEKVADELARLVDLPRGVEVNLWFEYELFCSVNMWFCMYLLHETEAVIYRVEPAVLSHTNRWSGFAKLGPDELKECFAARRRLSSDDVVLGAGLWNAYRKGNLDRLMELSKADSAIFPYLDEVCVAALNKETRPVEVLRSIREDGFETFPEIFPEFVSRAGEYGFGDTQVKSILEKLDVG